MQMLLGFCLLVLNTEGAKGILRRTPLAQDDELTQHTHYVPSFLPKPTLNRTPGEFGWEKRKAITVRPIGAKMGRRGYKNAFSAGILGAGIEGVTKGKIMDTQNHPTIHRAFAHHQPSRSMLIMNNDHNWLYNTTADNKGGATSYGLPWTITSTLFACW